jgi:hypothetical protein
MAGRGIRGRIARRGVESSDKLGRHCWVVERWPAWLTRFLTLTIRYERKPEIHLAFPAFTCALLCMGRLP